jgi:hypothetical protein
MTQNNPARRPRRTSIRWMVLAVGASTLLAPTAARANPDPVRAAASPDSQPAAVAAVAAALGADSPQAQAASEAASTGDPVEVESLTTETNKLVANPDGTFVLDAHREAVRTDIHGEWEPIDTTIVVNPDGTMEPRAITIPVTFTDGGADGSQPVATAGEGDESLAFALDEGPLPDPVVAADQVTYPNVRPGVDLVFTANATGFSDALVVKTPAAADALAADPIEFTGTSDGLDLATTADGTLVAANSGGDAVLLSPPPIAWDSSGGGRGENKPAADTFGTGAIHELAAPEIVDAEATSAAPSSVAVEVSPPATALDDPDTVYPLYLDPQIDGRLNTRFRTVHSGGWNYGTPSTEVMRVGYCDWSGCNSSYQDNARSYFEFDVTALSVDGSDPTIRDAKVTAQQVWNADSAAQPVQLRRSTNFTSAMTYPGNSGATLDSVSSAAGHNNNPAWLTFDSADVQNYIQERANAEAETIHFALSAPYENNKYFWKKFNNDTRLTVIFGYAPRITSYTSTNTVACGGVTWVPAPGELKVKVVAESVYGNPEMSFAAQVFETDATNNGPWDSTTMVTSSGWQSNGTVRTWTNTRTNLPNGTLAWRAWARTEIGVPTPSGGEYTGISKYTDAAVRPITVDRTVPLAPKITTSDYPDGWWGPAASAPGNFKVTMPSGADAIAYAFNADLPTLPTTTCYPTAGVGTGYKLRSAADANGEVEIAGTNLRPGVPNTLTVYSFDKAHNTSAAVTQTFYVSPDIAGTTTPTKLEAEGSSVTAMKNPTLPGSSVEITGQVAGAGATDQYLTATATDSLAYVDLSFAVNEPGYFAIGARVQTCPTCGTAEFSVPSDQIRDRVSVNSYNATSGTAFVQVGGYKLDAGNNTLRVGFPSASTSAPTIINIDSLSVIRLQGAPYASLRDAFNNDGITQDNDSNATDDDLGGMLEKSASGQQMGLSATKLKAILIEPGKDYSYTFTPAGSTTPATVKFPIPTANGIADNVVAAGQEIAMPGTSVHHVDFLVAATCGTVPMDSKIQFTLTHQPTSGAKVSTDSMVPSTGVPDWKTASVPVPANARMNPVTMNGYTTGNPAASATGNVNLYVMEIDVAPANRQHPLTSITLPRTGATLTQTCNDGPQLHVLAMTTRNDPTQ